MKYYKLLTTEEFIGVVNSKDFVRINTNNGWLLTSNEILGQFVSYKNTLYRDYWMQPIPNNIQSYTNVSIQEITLEEYDALKEAIDNNEPIIIDDDDDDDEIIPEPDPQEVDELVNFMRYTKINQMSKACHTTIENGFDLDLRGETKHFSLTTQDQLNLMNLSTMIQTQDLIPYHADGEETLFYSAEEIREIIAAANSFKIYQTTYFNALKTYINALETIEEISAIEYGVTIPEEYKSDVLRMLEQ